VISAFSELERNYAKGQSQLLTGTTAPSLIHQINRTPRIQIDKIDPIAFVSDHFCTSGRLFRFISRNLDSEDSLGRMASDERPFFFGALEERVREPHFATGYVYAEGGAQAPEGLKSSKVR
jgi:hypothetical protein